MSSSCGAPSSIMINPIIQTSWKSPKGGNQTTIAPKSTLFKSVKYINMNPSNNLTSMPVSAKYEAKYMPMTKFDNRR